MKIKEIIKNLDMENKISEFYFKTRRDLISVLIALLLYIGFHTFFVHSIPESIPTLIIFTAFVSLAAIIGFRWEVRRLEELADRLETTVQYVQEEYAGQANDYHGVIWKKAKEYVKNADHSIWILGAPIDHPTTEEHMGFFLKSIEDKIEKVVKCEGKSFEYIRVQQIRDLCPAMIDSHCKKINSLRNKEQTDILLDVLRLKQERVNSFIIIDERFLILGIDGFDKDLKPYMVGAFFMEDRKGRIINKFRQYFRYACNKARKASEKLCEQCEWRPERL